MTTGVDTATAAQRFKLALYTAALELFADDQATIVSFGLPGNYDAEDLVAFMGTRSRQDVATQGTNRARAELLTQDVLIASYRGGDWEQEIVASDRAYEMLRRLEVYTRVTNTQLAGLVDPIEDGVVERCWLESHDSEGRTDPDDVEVGRSITITATLVASVRIKSAG